MSDAVHKLEREILQSVADGRVTIEEGLLLITDVREKTMAVVVEDAVNISMQAFQREINAAQKTRTQARLTTQFYNTEPVSPNLAVGTPGSREIFFPIYPTMEQIKDMNQG